MLFLATAVLPILPAGATMVDHLEAPVPGTPGLTQAACDWLIVDEDVRHPDPAAAARAVDSLQRTARRLRIAISDRSAAVNVRGLACLPAALSDCWLDGRREGFLAWLGSTSKGGALP